MFLTYYLLLTILFIFLINILYFLYKYSVYVFKINKFPGPKGFPLIGGVLRLLGTPESIFSNLREMVHICIPYGTFAGWLTTIPIIGTVCPEDIEIILSNTINNTKSTLYDPLHPYLGTGLLTSTGKKWKTRRKLLTPAFHFSITQTFLKVFIKETNKLVHSLQKNKDSQDINVISYITKYTLNSICEAAMGTSLDENKDNEKYRKAVYDMGECIIYRITHPWLLSNFVFSLHNRYQNDQQTIKCLHDFSNTIINKRRDNLNKNIENKKSNEKLTFLDLLLEEERTNGSIDHEGIREEVDTFMFEGHDTTSMALCFLLMLLANNKNCQDKLYQEIITILGENEEHNPTINQLNELKYMEMCIKESLRLYPSVPIIARRAGEDIKTSSGRIIPQGCQIFVYIYDLHRRSDIYPDPLKFIPERFLPENTLKRHPFAYIPFSAGPRNCIGQKFAMLEMKCAISGLLKKFQLEPIDTPESIILIQDIIIRNKNEVKVKFVPRH